MVASFHDASSDLCDALATLSRFICTMCVNPNGLTAFMVSTLIALDKCQGLRLIRIGKAFILIGTDIGESAGTLQLCDSQHRLRRCSSFNMFFLNPKNEAANYSDGTRG